MAVQFSEAIRKAMLDATESQVGDNGKLIFYKGTKPANCAAPASGGDIAVVATLTLTGNWMDAAVLDGGGTYCKKIKSATSSWSAQATLAGTNTITFYRIYDASQTTCHEQGTVTSSVGGDIILDNVNVAQGQTITITAKELRSGNN